MFSLPKPPGEPEGEQMCRIESGLRTSIRRSRERQDQEREDALYDELEKFTATLVELREERDNLTAAIQRLQERISHVNAEFKKIEETAKEANRAFEEETANIAAQREQQDEKYRAIFASARGSNRGDPGPRAPYDNEEAESAELSLQNEHLDEDDGMADNDEIADDETARYSEITGEDEVAGHDGTVEDDRYDDGNQNVEGDKRAENDKHDENGADGEEGALPQVHPSASESDRCASFSPSSPDDSSMERWYITKHDPGQDSPAGSLNYGTPSSTGPSRQENQMPGTVFTPAGHDGDGEDDDKDEATSAEITPDRLVLYDNGTIFTYPPIMDGVPVGKIGPGHWYYESGWMDLAAYIKPTLDEWTKARKDNIADKSLGRYGIANRQSNRGRAVLDYLKDGEIHPYQLVGKNYLRRDGVGYDRVYRIVQVLQELAKLKIDLTPSQWFRQRLHEIWTEQGDRNFNFWKVIDGFYNDPKLKALRTAAGFGTVGRPSGYRFTQKPVRKQTNKAHGSVAGRTDNEEYETDSIATSTDASTTRLNKANREKAASSTANPSKADLSKASPSTASQARVSPTSEVALRSADARHRDTPHDSDKASSNDKTTYKSTYFKNKPRSERVHVAESVFLTEGQSTTGRNEASTLASHHEQKLRQQKRSFSEPSSLGEERPLSELVRPSAVRRPYESRLRSKLGSLGKLGSTSENRAFSEFGSLSRDKLSNGDRSLGEERPLSELGSRGRNRCYSEDQVQGSDRTQPIDDEYSATDKRTLFLSRSLTPRLRSMPSFNVKTGSDRPQTQSSSRNERSPSGRLSAEPGTYHQPVRHSEPPVIPSRLRSSRLVRPAAAPREEALEQPKKKKQRQARPLRRLRSEAADLQYDGYTEEDSYTEDSITSEEWRLYQVKMANIASNTNVTQFWHWVPDEALFEHQVLKDFKRRKNPARGGANKVEWSTLAQYNFHLRLDEITEVMYAAETLYVVVGTKGVTGHEYRGDILAYFKRERTKRRFLTFIEGKGIELVKTTTEYVKNVWEGLNPPVLSADEEGN